MLKLIFILIGIMIGSFGIAVLPLIASYLWCKDNAEEFGKTVIGVYILILWAIITYAFYGVVVL